MSKFTTRITCAVLALFFLQAQSAHAHSGQIALAYPVHNIELDGDFSDWPSDLPTYPITLPEYGDPPLDAGDFAASFRIGYDIAQGALYLAVDVRDESVVIDHSENAEWDTQDGCDLYLSTTHHQDGAIVVQYGLYGERLLYGNESYVKWQAVRHAQGHRYEWRIDLRRLWEGELPANASFGFDIVVEDKDADDSFSWMAWGKGTRKFSNPERLGDAILLTGDSAMGTVSGALRWADGGVLANEKVSMQARDRPEVQISLSTDDSGRFSQELPSGSYQIRPQIGRNAAWQQIEVLSATETHTDLLAAPSPGEIRPAGAGKTVLAGAGVRQDGWHFIGAADGLTNNAIYAIQEDQRGNLWLGTRGLVRYDGESFFFLDRDDGLPSNDVRALAIDTDGILWIGTFAGLARYDGQTFTNYDVRDGLVHDTIHALSWDGSALWIGTEGGLSRYDGQRFVNFTTSDGLENGVIYAVRSDGEGGVWIGSEDGLAHYDGQAFAHYALPSRLTDGEIYDIWFGSNEDIWLATKGGMYHFDGSHFETLPALDGILADNEMRTVHRDEEGMVWFGSYGGLGRYDGERVHTYTANDGLAQNAVLALLEDSEGGMWYAGDAGLTRYDSKGFKRLLPENGLLDHHVEALYPDDQGRMWIGSNRGINLYANGALLDLGPQLDHPVGFVRDLLRDAQGNTWIGTLNGLLRYDGQQTRHFTMSDGLPNNKIQALALDRRGDLWIATWGGVSRYDGEKFHNLNVEEGLLHKLVWDLLEDRDGHMYFATEKGLSRYDGETLVNFTTRDGLAHNTVRCLLEGADGTLWIGTDGGVCRYDGTAFSKLATEDLTHNLAWALLEDKAGRLWIGTDGGLGLYDGQVVQSVLRRDGLSNNAIRSLAEDAQGNIWIGTLRGGVTRYTSRHAPPSIHLKDIVADRRYGALPTIALPSSQQLLSFEFVGHSFKTRPEAVVYRYRLAGFDSTWHNTHDRRVEYRDLPRGNYTFAVRAVDRDLGYSAPAQVEVEIHWPYRWVAMWSVLAGVLALSAWQARQIWRRSLHLRHSHAELATANEALQQSVDEKDVLIKEVHHRVKNNMQVISSLLTLRANSMDESLRAPLEESQDRIMAMAMVHEQLYRSHDLARINLKDYVEQLVHHLQSSSVDPLPIYVEIAEGMQLDLERATSCGLLLNELVSNAIKHAFPDGQHGHIWVRIDQDEREIALEVRDDGIGMPAAIDSGNSLGLKLVDSLCRQLLGRVETLSENGTCCRVYFPIETPRNNRPL